MSLAHQPGLSCDDPPHGLLETAVADGTVPGGAALVARGDEVRRRRGRVDSIVRVASITKPIVAAAVMPSSMTGWWR
jgi:CubicO group peptidase (beta-lactamase class C family)